MGEATRPRRRAWEPETANALHRAESSREAWGAGGLDRAAAGVGQDRPDGTGTVHKSFQRVVAEGSGRMGRSAKGGDVRAVARLKGQAAEKGTK